MRVTNFTDTPKLIYQCDFIYALEKSEFFYQLYYMRNAIYLPSFEIYILLEMRIMIYIFVFIAPNMLYIVHVNL